jgi:hypothetical protein
MTHRQGQVFQIILGCGFQGRQSHEVFIESQNS